MTEEERLDREKERLEREVRLSAALTDADRIRILRDLCRTADAIRAGKTAEEIRREDDARRSLDAAGLRRYIALAERLAR